MFHLLSRLPLVDFFVIFGSRVVLLHSSGILFLCSAAFCLSFCLLSCFLCFASSSPLGIIFHISSLNSLPVTVRLPNPLFSSLSLFTPSAPYSPPGPLFWQSTLRRLKKRSICSSSLSATEQVTEFKESPVQPHTSPTEPALLQRITSQTPTQPEASSVKPVSHAASELRQSNGWGYGNRSSASAQYTTQQDKKTVLNPVSHSREGAAHFTFLLLAFYWYSECRVERT